MYRLEDLTLSGKRVLIRQDLNVPVDSGRVSSDKRIVASLPTIRHAIKEGASVMIMSHLGRPKEGQDDPQFSLSPVAQCLSEHLGQPVRVCRDYLCQSPKVEAGQVLLL